MSLMKSFIWLPLACLAGIVIGAWGPRERLRTSLDNARKRAQEEARWGASRAVTANGFHAFARLANIQSEATRPHRRRADSKPLFNGGTNKPPGKAAAAAAGAANRPQEERQERLAPADLRSRIEEAQALWSARVELARAKWREKLGLDDEAAERFDAVLDGMNEQLYDTMLAMSTQLARQDRMTPELGLKMMGDATTILAETYDRLGACVPDGKRAEVSNMQVFEFIDPGVAEPLIDVQDKLENFPMQGDQGR